MLVEHHVEVDHREAVCSLRQVEVLAVAEGCEHHQAVSGLAEVVLDHFLAAAEGHFREVLFQEVQLEVDLKADWLV